MWPGNEASGISHSGKKEMADLISARLSEGKLHENPVFDWVLSVEEYIDSVLDVYKSHEQSARVEVGKGADGEYAIALRNAREELDCVLVELLISEASF